MPEAVRTRTTPQVLLAVQIAIDATRHVRDFFRKLGEGFREEVMHSHGDHIPLRVRDDSVALFWLPEILLDRRVSNPSEFPQEALRKFWSTKEKRIPYVLAHVANQLSAFEWPSSEQVMQQYKDLMHAWSLLLNDKEIAKQVFGSTTLVASQGHSSQHHFDWLQWWKLSHTDPRFLPPGTEAAFVLFHFMGMVGVSEAGAESIASLLKRYSPSVASRINTERVIEKTIVASVGIKGLFTDDIFLLRCWVE